MLRSQIFSRENGRFEAKTRHLVWSRLVAESAPGARFPFTGPWREVFHSDIYDNWVNPIVAGKTATVSTPPARRLIGYSKRKSVATRLDTESVRPAFRAKLDHMPRVARTSFNCSVGRLTPKRSASARKS